LSSSVTTIGDVCEVSTGQSAPQKSDAFSDNGYPFIRAGSLNYLVQGDNENALEKINDENARRFKMRLFPPGTIIFAKSGMSATLGRVYELKRHCYVVSHLATLIPDSRLDSNYLLRWLERNPPSCLIANEAYPSIKTSEIQNIRIPLPDIAEQRRIVTILDKADAIRKKHRESLKLADEFLRSVFLDMFGNPLTNSKRFPIQKLANLGNLQRGKSRHRPRDYPRLYGGPYPFIQTGDVANCNGVVEMYQQTYSELGLQQSRLWNKGTLCITIAANIGRTGILGFEACFPDSVVGFTPGTKVTSEYIQFWLGCIQNDLESAAPQVAQKNINLEILSNLDTPLPPLPDQQRFSSIVMNIRSRNKKREAAVREADSLFGSLAYRAFSGQL
jgi:type I restriction enzyme S subunit